MYKAIITFFGGFFKSLFSDRNWRFGYLLNVRTVEYNDIMYQVQLTPIAMNLLMYINNNLRDNFYWEETPLPNTRVFAVHPLNFLILFHILKILEDNDLDVGQIVERNYQGAGIDGNIFEWLNRWYDENVYSFARDFFADVTINYGDTDLDESFFRFFEEEMGMLINPETQTLVESPSSSVDLSSYGNVVLAVFAFFLIFKT